MIQHLSKMFQNITLVKFLSLKNIMAKYEQKSQIQLISANHADSLLKLKSPLKDSLMQFKQTLLLERHLPKSLTLKRMKLHHLEAKEE